MPIGTKNTVIPGCGAHHISIQTRDLPASLRLYHDVLGMRVVAEFGSQERPMKLLDMGDGSHIELVGTASEGASLPEGSSSAGASYARHPVLHFALATTDTRQAVERVRGAGYEITVEPRDVNLNGLPATIAFFKGPSGEEIEFFQIH